MSPVSLLTARAALGPLYTGVARPCPNWHWECVACVSKLAPQFTGEVGLGLNWHWSKELGSKLVGKCEHCVNHGRRRWQAAQKKKRNRGKQDGSRKRRNEARARATGQERPSGALR